MQAFSKCKEYKDYLSVIQYAYIDGVSYYEENDNGFIYLNMIKDEKAQKKIMKVLKRVDQELSENSVKNNEIKKKINYILVLGILSHDYQEIFEQLDSEELFALIYGYYSKVDESNIATIRLFSNKRLLDAIIRRNEEDEKNKKSLLFGISDYFFMIEQHFNNAPFDINDDEQLTTFIDCMIEKLDNNTLHNGVRNMLEYWQSSGMEELKKGALR